MGFEFGEHQLAFEAGLQQLWLTGFGEEICCTEAEGVARMLSSWGLARKDQDADAGVELQQVADDGEPLIRSVGGWRQS